MRILRMSSVWAFACGLFLLIHPAHAKLVPIAITAEVTHFAYLDDFFEGRINVGDLVTGVYIYDLSTPDSDPSPGGLYVHDAPPAGITLTAGGLVFMTDPENVEFIVKIENNYPAVFGPRDSYIFNSLNNLPLSNGFAVERITLSIVDNTGSAISSSALPTTAPVLDDWETGRYDLYVECTYGTPFAFTFAFDAHLTSAVLIPEPATILLLIFGGSSLLRKCKTRKSWLLTRRSHEV